MPTEILELIKFINPPQTLVIGVIAALVYFKLKNQNIDLTDKLTSKINGLGKRIEGRIEENDQKLEENKKYIQHVEVINSKKFSVQDFESSLEKVLDKKLIKK